MGILDFPRPCNCGDNEACTHCFVNSTMFSLINEAWDYNWKSLSDKDIMSSFDNFWKSVPREKKTLIISKLKTSVSEENRHEFLIRNSLSEENRKFLIDNFNCTLESDKFVFYQNKKIPIRYIPSLIREVSEEEVKYEETSLGRELDENNISVEVLQKINQLKGGQNYASYKKTKTGTIMKKKLYIELQSEYEKTYQINNSISYKKEILRKDSRLGLQDYVTYWTPDQERFYVVVEEPCCISLIKKEFTDEFADGDKDALIKKGFTDGFTDGFLTDWIVEKIAGNSDFLKKYEEYVEQVIKKQEEEYEEQRLNRERQRLEKQRKEKERIKRISMIAEEKNRVEKEKKRLEEEKKIANRERNRQRQLEKNQKEKEARKLLEQKKKEEDQAIKDAIEQNQKSNEYLMKNFVGPMWPIYCNNESSQNMNDSLHNTSEPILKCTLHTEGNKITGAEIYPPVNSQHVLRLPEMPQPPERPPGEFVLLNADTIYGKNESVAQPPPSLESCCQCCDACREKEKVESEKFNNLENDKEETKKEVQKFYDLNKKKMKFDFATSKMSPTFDFYRPGDKKQIYFAALLHPNKKDRLCPTFIERMYSRLYGKYPEYRRVNIKDPPIGEVDPRDQCRKQMEELIKKEKLDSVHCFNDWVMSLNDLEHNIFIVSYFYCCLYWYKIKGHLEKEPENIGYFLMEC